MAVSRRASAAFPRQWNPAQVPNWPVELDPTHPLAGGLRRFFVPGNTLNDLSGNGAPIAPALATQPGVITTSVGPGFQTPASPPSNAGFVTPLLPGVSLSTGATLWMYRQVSGVAGAGAWPWILALWNSSTDFRSLVLYSDTGSSNYLGFANSSFVGTFGAAGTVGNTMQTNAITWAASAGSVTSYYYSGTTALTNTQGSGITTLGFNPASHSLWISSGGNQTILAGGLWDRALSQSETAWLAAEPFAALRPVVRRQYYAAAAVVAPAGGDELLFHPVF